MARLYYKLSLIFCCSLMWSTLQCQATFTEVAQSHGLQFDYQEALKMGGGAATFDHNGDGFDDLYIVGGDKPDGLFLNNGDGTFLDISVESGVAVISTSVMTTSVTTGDINNDGRREIFVGTIGATGSNLSNIQSNLLLQFDDNSGQYNDISFEASLVDSSFCMGGHFFDADLDGFLDLYVSNYVDEPSVITEGAMVVGFDHECYANKLYINNGDGTFRDETNNYGLGDIGCTLASTTSDLNWDGAPDLIIANDFGKWLEPNQLFQNEGANVPFKNISEISGTNAQMYGMGIALGDYDEDLDMDFYVTNIGENYFFRNDGDMLFSNVAEELEVQNTKTNNDLLTTGWGAILEDLDNDSYLDLFVSNGYVYSVVDVDDQLQSDELYFGTEDHNFIKSTADSGIEFLGTSRGALCGDWNRDGRMDLITITNEVVDDSRESSIRYYQNATEEANWVGFALVGIESNRDAYGTKMILHADGRSFMREVRGGSSHASQSSSNLLFGLGNIVEIDSVEIYWPSGLIEIIHDIQSNTYTEVIEGSISTSINEISSFQIKAFPNPATNRLTIQTIGFEVRQGILQIVNNLGKVMISCKLKSNMKSLDISLLPSGTYFLQLNDETRGILTEKIFIQNH